MKPPKTAAYERTIQTYQSRYEYGVVGSARSASAGSTGYRAFQASKPPSRAAALKPNLFSLRAARALVASSGQVQ